MIASPNYSAGGFNLAFIKVIIMIWCTFPNFVLQFQVLVEDSARLQKKYPTNATAILTQLDNVMKSWENLKEKSALRSDQLAASCDLQTFLTQVRDLMLWASNLRATLQAEEHVRDAAGATALKIQHDAIYNEIEAREEKFRYLSELSDSMVQTGHYAAAEVEERCSALLDERSVCIQTFNQTSTSRTFFKKTDFPLIFTEIAHSLEQEESSIGTKDRFILFPS